MQSAKTPSAPPDLSPIAAAAVCRGACRAVSESPLADPGTLPPPGEDLVAAAAKIGAEHEEETHG